MTTSRLSFFFVVAFLLAACSAATESSLSLEGKSESSATSSTSSWQVIEERGENWDAAYFPGAYKLSIPADWFYSIALDGAHVSNDEEAPFFAIGAQPEGVFKFDIFWVKQESAGNLRSACEQHFVTGTPGLHWTFSQHKDVTISGEKGVQMEGHMKEDGRSDSMIACTLHNGFLTVFQANPLKAPEMQRFEQILSSFAFQR
jgi:hypothetical protein